MTYNKQQLLCGRAEVSWSKVAISDQLTLLAFAQSFYPYNQTIHQGLANMWPDIRSYTTASRHVMQVQIWMWKQLSMARQTDVHRILFPLM